MSQDNQIEIKLSIEETNTILEALGQLPFSQVFQLISKIQNQAAQQLNQPESTTETAPTGSPAKSKGSRK